VSNSHNHATIIPPASVTWYMSPSSGPLGYNTSSLVSLTHSEDAAAIWKFPGAVWGAENIKRNILKR